MVKEYDFIESSFFTNLYKKISRKYKRTFHEDYDRAIRVITNLSRERGWNNLPQTNRISNLGKDIEEE